MNSSRLRLSSMAICVFCLISICYPTVGTALGIPLINFDGFIRNAFRVHLDSVSYIEAATDMNRGNTPPDNPEEKRALHLASHHERRPKRLTCEDIEIQGYEDWLEGLNKAKAARAAATDNRWTAEMSWWNFERWNSPAYVLTNTRYTLLGNLRSAVLYVAVLGEDFDIARVLDQDGQTFTQETLNLVFSIRGWGYDILYENQLSDKAISLQNTTHCAGFVIFELEIE